ncbi:hypothetical protein BD310DRAFT_581863 [Dichomitus squalens]|uniref:Uncharacterized protein n=1 Tax=Dichomitus squalens TaxID=114155 RepID=A0A4Q9QA14_9APHY|nr:hypothetical protein BD310DRAFT_581863 [Dichomitus squalens]
MQQYHREDEAGQHTHLGHLLSQSHYLSDTAISTVTKAIFSCLKSVVGTDEDDIEELNKLGEYHKNCLLRPFRKFTTRTSSGWSPPSRPLFELTKEQINEMLAESPRNFSTSRKLVMKREDYRCIVTRIADFDFIQELEYSTGQPCEGTVESLVCCHIFAESTNLDINEGVKVSVNRRHTQYSFLCTGEPDSAG